jgi:hypothetical protein
MKDRIIAISESSSLSWRAMGPYKRQRALLSRQLVAAAGVVVRVSLSTPHAGPV